MAKLRNNRNICLYCFGDLDEKRVCRACGRRDNDEPALPHHLARRTVLKKRYLIDRSIGEGGFGITYVAWDLQTSTKVAIKEYYPSGYVSRDPRSSRVIINSKQNHAPSNRGLKRFIDEAKNLSGLKKLNGIVTAHDFFSDNNTAYLVMEYLDGISLKKYIKRKGKLDCNTVLKILKPVIYSLSEVHAAGLIHRDISPDNILITKTNEVKLIDFGASKTANPDGQSVSIVLKQGFAPEEQYRLHGEQGPWTDIYALAVTVYYCITGQVPPESIQRMYDDTIQPPSALGAKITKRQENALMNALAVFAKDRTQSVDELIESLYDEDENPFLSISQAKIVTTTLPTTTATVTREDDLDVTEDGTLTSDATAIQTEHTSDAITVDATKIKTEEKIKTVTPPSVEPKESTYYFPPRNTSMAHARTAEDIRKLFSTEIEDEQVDYDSEPLAAENTLVIDYIPRTTFVERRYSPDELRKKLLKK